MEEVGLEFERAHSVGVGWGVDREWYSTREV